MRRNCQALLIFACSVFPGLVSATTITFPVGTTVDYNSGTYTVIRGDYRFVKFYYLAINTWTDAYRHAGGLWVHPSGGVGVRVERLDGHPFALDQFTVMERPGVGGYVTYDPFLVQAYEVNNPYSFGRYFYTDYNNHTYDTMRPVGSDPRFGRVTQAWIYNEYPFILDSLELFPVPEPTATAALCLGPLGLVSRRRLQGSRAGRKA